MGKTIAIVAPLIDNCQFNLDFTVRLKDSNLDLSLARLYRIAAGSYNPDIENSDDQVNDIPAAGYYLQGILHLNGYNTILTNKYDTQTLRELAQRDLFAVCISTTMILTGDSFIALVESVEREIPGIPVIAGGMFLWKQYQQYIRHLNFPGKYSLIPEIFFHPSNARSTKSILVVAEHGMNSLLKVLSLCEKGSKASFNEVENLCLQDTGKFIFTKREIENTDYNNDVTRWDLIDRMPVKIPVRTSIGCPYRCGFCDFCKVFPRIFLRSADSLKAELQLIKNRLNGNAALIHVTDDNVFITSRRLFEICSIFSSSGLANWIAFMRGGFASYHAYPLIIQNLSELAEPGFRKEWEIKGFLKDWSHKTMNSHQAIEASHKLFREVEAIPYHYPSESHFYNKGMFSRDTLSELYRLRQQLTIALMDNSPWEKQSLIIRAMLSQMELPAGAAEKFNNNLVCQAE